MKKEMKKKYYSHVLMFLGVTACSTLIAPVYGAEEDIFLGQMRSPSEQTLGHGRTALWTLPLVAAQYQPSKPSPAMQKALQAQNEGRFLDAMIALDEARGQAADVQAEMDLLRASFLLQGSQFREAQILLTPLSADARHAGDAYALTAMSYLQQGKMREALEAAQRSHEAGKGVLPHLALSYALQGNGKLMEARETVHSFNASTPQEVTLAREAELDLTLGQVSTARALVQQSQATNGVHSYVVAVSGLAYLIDEQPARAKTAFESALRRDPQDPKALLGLGLAEIKLGNLQEGMKKLQAANESEPGNALILTYLGRAQQQAGQEAAARESWHAARQADPKDPMPWLYQAQSELQANRPLEARESLREAQARVDYRSVYRGAQLLKEDEQLLQSNQAEVQRQLGLEGMAFNTLSLPVGEKNAATLRNQADLLQGQRFGESARRSLLLQSLFEDKPGNLPSELDIFGDGAGQTGASVPQHGAISELNARQASYNNYDSLFSKPAKLSADVFSGGQNSKGEQVRAGLDGGALGLGIAARQYKTDGNTPFSNLDNRIGQLIAQWQPNQSMQAFVLLQSFNSKHGETLWPADPFNWGEYDQIEDNSSLSRVGLRYRLNDNSEVRGLLSRQQTSQKVNWEWISNTLPYSLLPCCGPTLPFPQGSRFSSSENRSAELQYRRSGEGYATQWGVLSARSPLDGSSFGTTVVNVAQQVYGDWQQQLNPAWQLEAGLAWGRNNKEWAANSTFLEEWLPKLGVIYTPDSATHVRFAAWKTLDAAATGDASLSSASLVGFMLGRPGDTYKRVRSVALGAEKLLGAWLLEGQGQRRWTDDPMINAGLQSAMRNQVDNARLALHWQAAHSLNVTLAYDDEYVRRDISNLWPDSLLEQHLRSELLGLRWLAGEQWTANFSWSYNLLSATQQSSDMAFNPILLDVRQSFNQADASVNWQFSKMGSIDLGVRNAANRNFAYTESDPLIPRFSKGRLGYAKLKLNW